MSVIPNQSRQTSEADLKSIKKPYWTNRLARPEERGQILDLVHAVHGDAHPELNATYFQWRYLNDTPFRASVMMAEFDGRPIGIQPIAYFDWQWGDANLKGGMYTGVLTHPDHRRRGVFRSLIDSSNEHAASCGAQFVMTLPNEASLPGFLRFGDWQYPGLIPMMVKVINLRKALDATPLPLLGSMFGWVPAVAFRPSRGALSEGGIACDRVSQMPEDLDTVTGHYARDVGNLMIRRTSAYMNWRYAMRPGSTYRLYVARRKNQVVGAVVTSQGVRARIGIGMIVDFVSAADAGVKRSLIRAAEDDIRDRGLGVVACQATSPVLMEALRMEGFREAPPSVIRKRFHFIYRRTGVAGLPSDPARISDWHLNFGDSDNV